MIKIRKLNYKCLLYKSYSKLASYFNNCLCNQNKSKLGKFQNQLFIVSSGPLSSISFNLGPFLSFSGLFMTPVFECCMSVSRSSVDFPSV